MRHGFSLVELSIVLVILGLLTGGILAGQSLIRASELRSVTTTEQRYQAAMMAFRDKYFALPGDMPNATKFWGTATCPGTYATPSTGTATCDGNGNGQVWNEGSGGTDREELYRFWQHLANAGLIEGSYTGVQGPGNTLEAVPGQNVPMGRLGEGYGFSYTGVFVGSTTQYNFDYGSRFFAGTYVGAANSWGLPRHPFLTPQEVWNIDTKNDDGVPGTGKIMVIGWTNCTTATSSTDFTGAYKLTNPARDCALNWVRQ